MSILLHHPKTSPALTISAPASRLRWAAADDGFWVADNDGAFAGTVDQNGSHFFVRKGFGDNRFLPAAQRALGRALKNAQTEPPA
ncbi:hypothetical protein [Curtobacterium sp. 24E2]|nr:hypothetical protein JN350_09380 [Curtobacterium sp. 24E2]